MRSIIAAALTCIALATTACSYTVGPLEPKPNVALPTKSPAFELELRPTIKDAYEVKSTGNIMGGNVESWRASLKKGFDTGFADGSAANGTVKLRLEVAEFVFVPAAILANGLPRAVRAQLKFRGRWLVGDHEIPVSGTAEAKLAATTRSDIQASVESAIETMYERFAQALFQTLSKQEAQGELTPDKTDVDPKPDARP